VSNHRPSCSCPDNMIGNILSRTQYLLIGSSLRYYFPCF
jgi:hypothetical protein